VDTESGNPEVSELSGDWGYKRATLSSGYINTVAWSSTLAVGVRLTTSPRSHATVEHLVRRIAEGFIWQQLDIAKEKPEERSSGTGT